MRNHANLTTSADSIKRASLLLAEAAPLWDKAAGLAVRADACAAGSMARLRLMKERDAVLNEAELLVLAAERSLGNRLAL